MENTNDIKNGGRGNDCPMFELFDVLGKKRIINVLYLIRQGKSGFNEINKTIPLMSGKILSNRLKLLEQEKFITKEIENKTPLKIRYYLTERGEKIANKISEMGDIVYATDDTSTS